MKRNGKIELLRFLFSIGVLCLHIQKYIPGEVSLKNGIHFSFFPHGAIGVEFFFVLSGFLMAASVFFAKEEQKQLPLGTATVRFISGKFTSLLPMRLMVFVVMFALTVFTESWGFGAIVKKFISYIPGLFLVQMSGFGEGYINHIEWYLSAMLIGMFVIYPFLRKRFESFSKIVAPLVAVLVLGYMFQSYGRLTGVTAWEGLCYRSILRAIAELCLGVACFAACQGLKEGKVTKAKRGLFTALEIFCWGSVFVMMLLTLPRLYECYMLIFIAAGVICTFSGLSYGAKLFDNKVCFYLGKLSLPIYLCHLIPITLVTACLDFLPLKQQMLITFVSALVLAVLLHHASIAVTKGKKRKAG